MSKSVNLKRFFQSMEAFWECAGYGSREGLTILALSQEEKNVRDLLVKWMRCENLTVKVDDMGNIYGIRHGNNSARKPLAIGSHIDTVQNGGKYDGILGVLGGLEVIRCLNEAGIETEQDIVLCVWANEEGSRFLPGMAGSGVIAGTRTSEECYQNYDTDMSITYKDALVKIDYMGTPENRLGDIEEYLELHIEQGPVLEKNNLEVGIVSGIKAMVWNQITLTGESNHAGPCPMELRKDPLLAAMHVILEIEKTALENKSSSTTSTFGKFDVFPDMTTIIPQKVVFTQDLRSENDEVVEQGAKKIHDITKEISQQYHVDYHIEPIGYMESSKFDQRIQNIISTAMKKRNYKFMYLYSGAGHDAFQISKKYPTGMIFVRTKNGKSHVPEEHADIQDIGKGLQILLDVVICIIKNGLSS